jgi:hypothetical protein
VRLLPGYAPVPSSILSNVTLVNDKGQTVKWIKFAAGIKAFEFSGLFIHWMVTKSTSLRQFFDRFFSKIAK